MGSGRSHEEGSQRPNILAADALSSEQAQSRDGHRQAANRAALPLAAKKNSLARFSAECVLLDLELLVLLHGEPPGMIMCVWVSETRKESIFLV